MIVIGGPLDGVELPDVPTMELVAGRLGGDGMMWVDHYRRGLDAWVWSYATSRYCARDAGHPGECVVEEVSVLTYDPDCSDI
ncbi:MAG TPA: hypothetical protein VLE97_01045 [Gaiellaceae bacterium]|nr:hypothetical protein [Gaiellaceae bacterium]